MSKIGKQYSKKLVRKWSEVSQKLVEMNKAGQLPIKSSGAGAFKCGTLQTFHFLEIEGERRPNFKSGPLLAAAKTLFTIIKSEILIIRYKIK